MRSPRSRSSVSPIARVRRPRSAFAAASGRPSASGPTAGSPSTWRPRRCVRRARGSTCRSRSPCSRPRVRFPRDELERHAVHGELALDGRVRPVAGVFAVAEGAMRAGLPRIICAAQTAPEAALAGIEPVPVWHLAEAVAYLRGELVPEPIPPAEWCRSPRRSRPRRRPRSGASPTRARDRGGRTPQPPVRRSAGHGQDDARAPAARAPAAAGRARVARGDPHPLGRGNPPRRAPTRHNAAVSRAAPHRLGCGHRRRRTRAAARRSKPRASRRVAARRAARVRPARIGGPETAARGR